MEATVEDVLVTWLLARHKTFEEKPPSKDTLKSFDDAERQLFVVAQALVDQRQK